jgi:hypothetical protein
MSLRGKVSGRERTFLSGKPDGMDVPIKVAEGLYAEGYFDTEWLVKVLTKHILLPACYDYSGIRIAVIPNKL